MFVGTLNSTLTIYQKCNLSPEVQDRNYPLVDRLKKVNVVTFMYVLITIVNGSGHIKSFTHPLARISLFSDRQVQSVKTT